MSTTVRHRLDGVEINIDAVNRRLSDIEFFRDFSDEDKRQLLDTDKYLEVFEQGTTIIHEGEPEADLYVVIEGEADVFKRGSHKAIATLTMGSVFGEISFFSRKKRTTSIVAVDRVVVLKIPEDFFLELACPLQKKLIFQMVGLLIDRLEKMNAVLVKIKTIKSKAREKEKAVEDIFMAADDHA